MKLSKSEEKILTVLSYSKGKQRSTLVLQTGLSRTWVYEVLTKLENKGLAERFVKNEFYRGRPKVFWRRT